MHQDAVTPTDPIEHLVRELSKLPAIGPKSAQRITYYLLRSSREQTDALADALRDLRSRITLCSTCYNVTDVDPCRICQNEQRDRTTVCVVEQPQDVVAIEHTGGFRGLYHVLHGAISPTEGVGAGDVRIRELTDRLKDGAVREVILATNTNLEGEQTAMYLNHVLSPLGIRVTRLARGLPFGTELEYADDATLTRALEGRQTL